MVSAVAGRLIGPPGSQAASVRTGQQVSSGGGRVANVSTQTRWRLSAEDKGATSGPVSWRMRRSVNAEALEVGLYSFPRCGSLCQTLYNIVRQKQADSPSCMHELFASDNEALLPSRSKTPDCSREMAALPSRKSRPVSSSSRGSLPSEKPSNIPSRAESNRRRSSIGQSQSESSIPADAQEPATLPCSAVCRSGIRPAPSCVPHGFRSVYQDWLPASSRCRPPPDS
jgi:hypothetical protein